MVERQKPAHDSPHEPAKEHVAVNQITPVRADTVTLTANQWPKRSSVNVALTESGMRVDATLVDIQGIDRLIKMLQINKILLQEHDLSGVDFSAATEETDVPEC